MGRHSFAVNSASLGIPIEVVSKLLGHSSIRTTQIYYKLTDTKVDEWMDKWA
jgi:site-specific recombinase XerD